jgi:hypothetical protein
LNPETSLLIVPPLAAFAKGNVPAPHVVHKAFVAPTGAA